MTNENSNISFNKATLQDKKLLLSWLNKKHVREFWDNSTEHKNNLINYLNNKKELYDYWIGSIQSVPFCLVMTSDVREGTPHLYVSYLPKQGDARSIDFMIGNESFLEKGISTPALKEFVNFIKRLNPKINSFFIDPATNNTKAVHVYKKAGFKKVDEFIPSTGSFKGIKHFLMIKK